MHTDQQMNRRTFGRTFAGLLGMALIQDSCVKDIDAQGYLLPLTNVHITASDMSFNLMNIHGENNGRYVNFNIYAQNTALTMKTDNLTLANASYDPVNGYGGDDRIPRITVNGHLEIARASYQENCFLNDFYYNPAVTYGKLIADNNIKVGVETMAYMLNYNPIAANEILAGFSAVASQLYDLDVNSFASAKIQTIAGQKYYPPNDGIIRPCP